MERLGIVGLCVLLGSCGPDPDKLAQRIREQVKSDLEPKLRAELEKKMQAELALLEGRLRRRLGLPPARLPKAEPPRPRIDPGVKTAPKKAEVAATRPPDAGTPSSPLDQKPGEDPRGLTIKRLLFAKKLVERKPGGITTRFTVQDPRVYCYLDTANPRGPERLLQVVWHRNGREFHRVRLRVGRGHVWRTWAYLRIRSRLKGDWQCSVLNEQGQLLEKGTFSIK